jgi:hypothetical protein
MAKHLTRDSTCAARWRSAKAARVRDLRQLFKVHQSGEGDKYADTFGTFAEYGLSFDYVAPETFTDQLEGYWRYQLSWGGPSDEFRFYSGGCGNHQPYRVSYAFLDFFDGHERALSGGDLDLLRDIWRYFQDTCATEAAYRAAFREDRS